MSPRAAFLLPVQPVALSAASCLLPPGVSLSGRALGAVAPFKRCSHPPVTTGHRALFFPAGGAHAAA